MAINYLQDIVQPLLNQPIHSTTLPNHLSFIHKEDFSSPLISLQFWVKTGSIHEDHLLGSGLSHYLEHMLFKGTPSRSYSQITQDIQALGGSVNAYTTFDRTVYYIDGPASAFEPLLAILTDILFNSTIDPQETQKEQSVILREIDMGLDEPDYLLSRALFESAFKVHPYRHEVIGHRDLFLQLSQKDLLNYYKSRYIPNNITLVLAGAIPHSSALPIVHKYLAHIPPSPLKPIFIPQEPPQLSHRICRLNDDYHLSRATIAFKTPSLSHPDSIPLAILTNILAQGASSILYQKIREEKNLVHSISSSLWSPGSTGLLSFHFSCDPHKRQDAEAQILHVLNNLSPQDLPPSAIEKAITGAFVNEINSRKTISSQASRLGIAHVVIGDLLYPNTFLQKLTQVSQADLLRVASSYFSTSNQISVSLDPLPSSSSSSSQNASNSPSPATANPSPFSLLQLPNGFRILLNPSNHLPKIHFKLAALGGTLFESPQNRGLTSLLSTLLIKDTQKRSFAQIAQTLESIGASFSDFTGNNSFGLSLESLSPHAHIAIDILSQALLHPNFTPKNFNLERDSQIAAIKDELDEISEHGLIKLRQHFFGSHPYSSDPFGSIQSLQNSSLQDLSSLHKSLINPQNLVLAISGDFNPDSLLPLLLPHLESLPSTPFALPSFPQKFPATTGHINHFLDREQVVVFLAFPCPGVQSPDFDTTEVLDELLSNMSSNLFARIREEKGLAYFVHASRILGLSSGMFYLCAGTHPSHYKDVLHEMHLELSRLQSNHFLPNELSRAKTRLVTGHLTSHQTSSSLAMSAALDALYSFPTNHFTSYPSRIQNITENHISSFLSQNFTPATSLSFAIGPIK